MSKEKEIDFNIVITLVYNGGFCLENGYSKIYFNKNAAKKLVEFINANTM